MFARMQRDEKLFSKNFPHPHIFLSLPKAIINQIITVLL